METFLDCIFFSFHFSSIRSRCHQIKAQLQYVVRGGLVFYILHVHFTQRIFDIVLNYSFILTSTRA